MKNALIIVDIQNDFLPGGSLAVRDGDKVIPVINAVQKVFALVVATQDWHPVGHASFASSHPGKKPGDVIELGGLSQVLWPDHCVQRTPGAALADKLEKGKIARVFPKGTDYAIDSYSAFFDNAHLRSTGLGSYLQKEGVTAVCLAGLAADYCVKFSCLDALTLGFKTTVIMDACRGVDLCPGDSLKACEEMRAAGAKLQKG